MEADVLPIQETFVSIQGEGSLVGTESSFVRVTGCNLRCTWCDSPATSWHPTKTAVRLDALLAACAAGPRHVVLTGGEPLLFPGIARLGRQLRAAGHHVTVETAGTVWLDDMECDLLSVSPKLAHSTPWTRAPALAQRHEGARIDLSLLRRLLAAFPWQLKLVVRAYDAAALEDDAAEAAALIRRLDLPADRCDRVFLMPECTDKVRLSADYRALQPVAERLGFRVGERRHIARFGHTPGT